MKKFENLGKVLSKNEQKKIKGGFYPDPDCACGCKNDLECGIFVCSHTVGPCGPTACNARMCVPKEP